MIDVTAIFFSCTRLELLQTSVNKFIKSNTYPIFEYIIVNDSGNPEIHEKLINTYPNFTLVLHPENNGLIKSIDIGYSHINTEYFFHCEDDWCCNGKDGFIEKSLDIMTNRADIEEVWLAHYNSHPLYPEIIKTGNTEYRIAATTDNKLWHGFTTAMGLKRMSDYKKVGSYSDIPWNGTIWHREAAIGQKYFNLGYKTAVLTEDYAYNIGIGKSEYSTGWEK